MKSGMQAEQSWFGNLKKRFDRFLSGSAPSDPLYLTNRTWKQKVKVASMIGVPILVLIALVLIGSTDVFRFSKVDPYEHPLKEAPQPALAVNKAPEPKLAPSDLEVINIRIAHDVKPPVVTGIVRNNTGRKVDSAEVSYYVADEGGSLMGTETTSVQNLGAHSSVTFKAPLKTANAGHVLVRDVHPN